MPNRPSARPAAAMLLLGALALVPAPLEPQHATAALSLGMVIAAPRVPPALVVVPDVRGQSLSGAAAQVAVAGLVPRHTASTPGNLDTSPVRRQWPRAGQRVPEGTVVALELASPLGDPASASSRPAGDAAPAENLAMARLARASLTEVSEARAGRGRRGIVPWWAFAPLLAVAAAALLLPRPGKPRAFAPAPVAGRMAARAPLPDEAAGSPGAPPAAPPLRTRRGAPPFAVIAPGAVAAGARQYST
jgi:hypothetical protein